MAPGRVLGVHGDRGRRSHTAPCRAFDAFVLRAAPAGRVGSDLCFTRSSDVGPHTSGSGLRAACAVRNLSPLFTFHLARALAVSAWSNCGHYRLRDQRVLRWRMDRAECSPLLQHPILVLPWPGLAIQSARPANAEEALADQSDCRPSRNCNDAAGDGRLLCHQSNNAPRPPPVLRDCILDRLFRQLDHHRKLAFVQEPAGASLNTFDASGYVGK